MKLSDCIGRDMPKEIAELSGWRVDSDRVILRSRTTYQTLRTQGFSYDAIINTTLKTAHPLFDGPIHPKGREYCMSVENNCEKRVIHFTRAYLDIVELYQEHIAQGRNGTISSDLKNRIHNLLKFLCFWRKHYSYNEIKDSLDTPIPERLDFMGGASLGLINDTIRESYEILARSENIWDNPFAIVTCKVDDFDIRFV